MSLEDPSGHHARQKLIEHEIRVQQSVEILRFNLPIITGNVLAALLLYSFDPDLIVGSGAVFALAPIAVLCSLSLRSYLRLRSRPRPRDVSLRRIRAIEFSAAVTGLSWAAFTLLSVTQADPVSAVIMVLGVNSFAFAALVAMASSPRAAALAAMPAYIACGVGLAFSGAIHPVFAIAIFMTMMVVAGFCILANWRKTRLNVEQQVDNQLAEADRARTTELLSRRLSKYLSPQLFESILAGEQSDEIVSKRKKLTIFFSDIVGFTEITDRLESEELAALLNRYLTEMSDIAQQHGGTVDKFIGDALVVYFGDPNSKGVQEDAKACVRMAVAMQERVRALKTEWLDMGLNELFDLRIGINTGYCNVGNFGSDQRIDYTIIGSEVNLAARLEASAEVGGILLANETYALVKNQVTAEEGAPLTVKGFSRPVRAFHLRGLVENDRDAVGPVRASSSHLTLTMTPALMDAEEKSRAAAILARALDSVRDTPET